MATIFVEERANVSPLNESGIVSEHTNPFHSCLIVKHCEFALKTADFFLSQAIHKPLWVTEWMVQTLLFF